MNYYNEILYEVKNTTKQNPLHWYMRWRTPWTNPYIEVKDGKSQNPMWGEEHRMYKSYVEVKDTMKQNPLYKNVWGEERHESKPYVKVKCWGEM